MRKLYPQVISEEELDSFFDHPQVIDLYEIVQRDTDWPLSSYSLKDLAQYLGFRWQDESPSGALSIQWFNEFIETGDEKILVRLLTYNQDDCLATMVLKQALEKLPVFMRKNDRTRDLSGIRSCGSICVDGFRDCRFPP